MTMKCFYCETAAAVAIKVEDEMSWDDNHGGREILTPVEYPICDPCQDEHFDGTENHPGVKPLA